MLNALLDCLGHLSLEHFVTNGSRGVNRRIQLSKHVHVALGVHVNALHTRSARCQSRVKADKCGDALGKLADVANAASKEALNRLEPLDLEPSELTFEVIHLENTD